MAFQRVTVWKGDKKESYDLTTLYSNSILKIRPATKEDKEEVLRFCIDTFEWGDYIDQVWSGKPYFSQMSYEMW
jgi:hypothetical protein